MIQSYLYSNIINDNEKMLKSVYDVYGNKLRTRVCGICIENDKLLMVNHSQLSSGDFWAPPGGGIDFGESIENALHREYREETGLEIEVVGLLFVSELIKPPLHAIELFFEVKKVSGVLKTGFDPEMTDNQIIKEVKFLSWQEIDNIKSDFKHGIFKQLESSNKIPGLKGHFKL